jgi:L-ascorbate metabolism protein UlaG (beta-lactamase superfamily)
MGRYDDRATRPWRGPRDLLRWRVLDALRGRNMKDPGGFVTPYVKNDGAELRSLGASLAWVGHATFLMRLGGQVIATDPVFGDRISGVVPRRAPVGVELEDAPPIDVVTVSHNHRDHMDIDSLRRIGPSARYVVPIGNARFLSDVGLNNVVELDWWESTQIGDLRITLVPARHWSMRLPWDRNDGLWGGFVYESAEGRAYHAGDTALFDGFSEISRRCGPIDWAMLPIGAYEPRWFMEPQHMNPEDALAAFEQLGARILVAMHWGTFKLTDEPLGDPPTRIVRGFSERGWPAERLWLLAVGEHRWLAPPHSR